MTAQLTDDERKTMTRIQRRIYEGPDLEQQQAVFYLGYLMGVIYRITHDIPASLAPDAGLPPTVPQELTK